MDRVPVTRVCFVRSKDMGLITQWVRSIGVRIQVMGPCQFSALEKKWYLNFIPSDFGQDFPDLDLDSNTVLRVPLKGLRQKAVKK